MILAAIYILTAPLMSFPISVWFARRRHEDRQQRRFRYAFVAAFSLTANTAAVLVYKVVLT